MFLKIKNEHRETMGSQYFISDKCGDYGHICELNYNISVADNFMEEETNGYIILLIVIN